MQLSLIAAFVVGQLILYRALRRHLRDPDRRFASGRTLDLDPAYFTEEGQPLVRAYGRYVRLGIVILIAGILAIQAWG